MFSLDLFTLVISVLLAFVSAWTWIHKKTILGIIYYLPRDIHIIACFARFQYKNWRARRTNLTVSKCFDETANKNPNKHAIYYEDRTYTYAQVQEKCRRIANFMSAQGFKRGDHVALFIENSPEFICTFLGLSQLGIIMPLLNTNLRGKPLQHCLGLLPCKAVIYSTTLSQAMDTLNEAGKLDNMNLYFWGTENENGSTLGKSVNMNECEGFDTTVPKAYNEVGTNDHLCYIYTSGTTGLPKAVVIKQYRFLLISFASGFYNISPDDISYNFLPHYHTSGLLGGVGMLSVIGLTLVVRRKFSASNFWKDCIRHRVTAVQYIGEVCRYLTAQPPCPEETQHCIKIFFGNGLRPDVWRELKSRFRISTISEFYSSTEGNCNLLNVHGHVGAVGFVPRWATLIYPVALVKVDPVTHEFNRDSGTGFLQRCGVNERGELIGKINPKNSSRAFDGYSDATSTNSKIVENVFCKGDRWFRTGDIMDMDIYGFYYFKDRIGDTFRWKGENVSTFEVESTISQAIRLNNVAVYGVEIPGSEGRAGMAAIADPDNQLDLQSLSLALKQDLPSYAIPIFLRVMVQGTSETSLNMTTTYKIRKEQMQKEAYDTKIVSDPLYIWLNGQYEALTEETLSIVTSGRAVK